LSLYACTCTSFFSSKEEQTLVEEVNDANDDMWIKEFFNDTGASNTLSYADTINVRSETAKKNFTSSLNDPSKELDQFNSTNCRLNNSSKNHSNVYNIYKGMSYEEWIVIRDDFLKKRGMLE
jgi:hypothetical protein